MTYRVELDLYRGPLDLLLYLVRKHEIDVRDLSLATIAKQYAEYIEVLSVLNFGDIGEFLVIATTLAEIKSRLVLPLGGEEELEEQPRPDLVRQLLEYKKYRDAASVLEERSRRWQQKYPRLANDLPPRTRNLAEEPIHELELWDLVSAFSRIMRDNAVAPGTNIVYDDTPIEVYMDGIRQKLEEQGRIAFSELFRPGMHKSTLVGLFLAVLELVRHHGLRTDQIDLFDEIWLLPGPPLDRDAEAAANREANQAEAEPK